ncbi:hypothetical protein ABT143_17300 [Streptomyces sp. NPDC002033]|uniref:hypothetical protein n=1 Tax=unclassified Streptomyces TaxID=2593676 RepID=UPI0033248782
MITLPSAGACLGCIPEPERPEQYVRGFVQPWRARVPELREDSPKPVRIWAEWVVTGVATLAARGKADSVVVLRGRRRLREAPHTVPAELAQTVRELEQELARVLTALRVRIGAALLALAKAARLNPPQAVREALWAALNARSAAVHGDVETVDAFALTWLGISEPAQWREAVEAALTGSWISRLGRPQRTDDEALLKLLKRQTTKAHSDLLPLWERRVRGRRTLLLSALLGRATSEDWLADANTGESHVLLQEVEDSRLVTVLQSLTHEHQNVVLAWSDPGVTTWSEAAERAEAADPKRAGEQVRRRVRYLVDQQRRLGAQMGVAR